MYNNIEKKENKFYLIHVFIIYVNIYYVYIHSIKVQIIFT